MCQEAVLLLLLGGGLHLRGLLGLRHVSLLLPAGTRNLTRCKTDNRYRRDWLVKFGFRQLSNGEDDVMPRWSRLSCFEGHSRVRGRHPEPTRHDGLPADGARTSWAGDVEGAIATHVQATRLRLQRTEPPLLTPRADDGTGVESSSSELWHEGAAAARWLRRPRGPSPAGTGGCGCKKGSPGGRGLWDRERL